MVRGEKSARREVIVRHQLVVDDIQAFVHWYLSEQGRYIKRDENVSVLESGLAQVLYHLCAVLNGEFIEADEGREDECQVLGDIIGDRAPRGHYRP